MSQLFQIFMMGQYFFLGIKNVSDKIAYSLPFPFSGTLNIQYCSVQPSVQQRAMGVLAGTNLQYLLFVLPV